MASHFLMSLNRGGMTREYKYRLTSDAQTDLIEIRRFTLIHWGIVQSKEYLSKLRQTMGLLALSPQIGTLRPGLGQGVASFPHASHVIYYMDEQEEVVVFAVLHKAMVPARHLTGRKHL